MTEQDVERVARAIWNFGSFRSHGDGYRVPTFCPVKGALYMEVAKAAISSMPNKHEKALAVAREALGIVGGMTDIEADFDGFLARKIARDALATIDEIVGK